MKDTVNGSPVCYCYRSPDIVRSKKQNNKTVVRRVAGLSSKDSYNLEVSILKRLHMVESPCIRHWPKLLKYNDKTLTFTTSWDGYPLNTLKGRTQFCNMSVNSLIDQGRCIQNHLANSNVTHNDQHFSGKNLLIIDGHITVFDFNIATLDGKFGPLKGAFSRPGHYHHSVVEVLLRLRLVPELGCGKHSGLSTDHFVANIRKH